MRVGHSVFLLAVVFAAGCAATADDPSESTDDAVHIGVPPDASAPDAIAPAPDGGAATDAASPPPGPSTTTFADKLSAIGLDVNNLPSLHDLPTSQKLKVMRTFGETMGISCNACHDLSDYSAPTPQKETAVVAWENISRKLTMADGSPIYCDSCHYGKFDFLDHSDHHQLELWMKSSFVEKLRDKSGAPMACTTCHSEDPTEPSDQPDAGSSTNAP
jgi:hypothetical protein